MHILVTNDDGIDSPGLWALAKGNARGGCQGECRCSSRRTERHEYGAATAN
ncbi:MAG: hypothetical protein KatS3mg056_1956 [Chloroflexus sp.]|nr:MAG: hypothetical protein KatS3mg056_1956 [Chloroflexus sp.]